MTIYTYYFDLHYFLSYLFLFLHYSNVDLFEKNWKNYTKTYLNHTYVGMSIVSAEQVRVLSMGCFKNWKSCKTYLETYPHPKTYLFKNRAQENQKKTHYTSAHLALSFCLILYRIIVTWRHYTTFWGYN